MAVEQQAVLDIDQTGSAPMDSVGRGIQVVNGYGDPNSVIATADEIRILGYTVGHIEMVPQPDLIQNTIYYAPNFQDEAWHIAGGLAGKPGVMPISWPSVFDIVVVTGQKKMPKAVNNLLGPQGEAKRIANGLDSKPGRSPTVDAVIAEGKGLEEVSAKEGQEEEFEGAVEQQAVLDIDQTGSAPMDSVGRGIQVVNGYGDPDSVIATADEIRILGYTIGHIEMVPQPDLMQNTIYYAPNFQDEAWHIAGGLAGKPGVMPISWPSVFDIVVVTGQ